MYYSRYNDTDSALYHSLHNRIRLLILHIVQSLFCQAFHHLGFNIKAAGKVNVRHLQITFACFFVFSCFLIQLRKAVKIVAEIGSYFARSFITIDCLVISAQLFAYIPSVDKQMPVVAEFIFCGYKDFICLLCFFRIDESDQKIIGLY